ncbi:hypothetical protein J2W34_004335 [Variovorax boronicumulans]|uniref:hypothetical protein n=1 Tax=Variovorax boronicumulans TaxID=436515 RepID=UPI00277E4F0A|nr:hypothetical protein [Variovorax boronicumulans]MDQ0072530.1 hypothetical protein [Variovorax boronicumulans]
MSRTASSHAIQKARQADITVTLPPSLSTESQISALRKAGIPMDRFGEAISGDLFVRTAGRAQKRVQVFRWFAPSAKEAASTRPVNPAGVAGPIDHIRIWRQLERRALLELRALNQKLFTYLDGTGPAPEPDELEAVKRAYAEAHRGLLAAMAEMNRWYPLRYEGAVHGAPPIDLMDGKTAPYSFS